MGMDSGFDGDAFIAGVNQNMGELATTMGVALTKASPQLLVATMPVPGNRQPYGLLHGGANAVLAETIGSIHCALLAPDGTFPVGIEISCSHHRSARDGTVTAVCEPISSGKTLATMSITITDDNEQLCCTARLTCLFRPAN